MKIIRVYDGGERGGNKCVCGRTIRYVAEVEDGGARFNLGSLISVLNQGITPPTVNPQITAR